MGKSSLGKILGLIISMIGFAAHGMQSPEAALNDIQHSQFDDQYDVLLVGEKQIPLVISESNTAITRGVAVLISESGRNPFSEHGLSQLSTSLNNVGWVTMIMPAPISGFWPALDETTTNNQAADTSSQTPDTPTSVAVQETLTKAATSQIEQPAFELHEQQIIQQMQAVTGKTRQYNGFFLVIAQGTSAAWLTKIYAENKLDQPDGMVSISPQWPDRSYNQQLPKWVAETQMPYLDVYSAWDTSWAKATVSQRKIQSIKSLKMMYRQRELIGQTMDNQQFARLGKEIYGWLTHMGW
ncbi:DUF3530 family protein [Aliiglaciecola sp. 2_MG-2023]|uniref:DUF3530 family protein n=1 Tax=Alteromonadaceae TaxID=72275 RepID=UPI0026E1253D|nr:MULTISPECIES: DUF3530 family protein [unclassified Aliiglaciecola]MDO6711354.1 DUF3530 family protein [Aliiglaciecola sp. 2_MG-2023]MDO6752197.1 DUF3530 family protein [Aliiglaciecola sp. 1_MG-2023]